MRFSTIQELAGLCEAEGLTMGEIMLQEQARESGEDPKRIHSRMADYY